MNNFTLRIASTPKAALEDPHAIIWMKGEEWDDFHEIPTAFKDRTVIYTSAWQSGVYRASGMGSDCPNYFIVPEGCDDVRFRIPEYDGRIDIVWRGTDVGSAIMLLTVASALKLTKENCSIKLFGPATSLLLQNLVPGRDDLITHVNEDLFNDALSDSHVFVYPSFRPHSQHMHTVRAAKAGCVCIVPNMSGFREILGPFGNYVHQSYDNVNYAQSLAEKMTNTIESFKDAEGMVDMNEALRVQSTITSINFSTSFQDLSLKSVENQLSLFEASKIENSNPLKH